MCPFGKGFAAFVAEDDNPKLWLIKLGFSAIWAAITVGGHRRRDAGSLKKALPRREPFDLNEAVSEVKIMVRSANARIELPVSAHLTNGPVPVRAFNCKKSS